MSQDSYQHIYLTGYRGTGKTSVGKILAHRLDRQLVDLDDRVEAAAGKTIREIFDEGGEKSFRDWESKCLKLVTSETNGVIALGGGAILRESNRDLIASSGICFWLDADAATLAERIFGDQSTHSRRPALSDLDPADEIRHLLAQREPLYRAVSKHRIETTGKTIDAIAAEIHELLRA
ncbi:MAG: shikimate kinase [Pirellulaceae bacterium]